MAIADNAALLPHAGPAAAALIVTAAWTGARWGEIVGLQRRTTHLDPDNGAGCVVVDPRVGSLIKSSRGIELGPPKTAESARTITLPPFLTDLLRTHLGTHRHQFVFATPTGQPLRNSNFGRRALRPAVDGTFHPAVEPSLCCASAPHPVPPQVAGVRTRALVRRAAVTASSSRASSASQPGTRASIR